MTTDAATSRGRNGEGSRLVIVESPAKARTIERFLNRSGGGPKYVVESSIGHIRDLPERAAQAPDDLKALAKERNEPWFRIAAGVESDFQPLYIVPADKRQQVSKLRKLSREASEIYLATDEDREGEAIAWHLKEVLKPRVPVRRMVFHEITEQAINDALSNPREIDDDLVAAQEARRVLDYLYGYEVSPVLWKKVRPRLSAGRVQSVAIRLIVERERERMRFVSSSFWDVRSLVRSDEDEARPEPFAARLVELDGSRVATGRDFDPETGQLTGRGNVVPLGEERATAVATAVAEADYTVAEVNERPYTQRPPAPFITSSLQQEAARKLRFTAQRTMGVAQNLYQNGYITYMRTDSTNLSQQALDAARRQARDLYGAEYVPDKPRFYRARAKGAQEAHEAIRPAGDIFRTPDSLRGQLTADEQRLYDLVWKRTVASQMKDASGLRTNARLEAPAGAEGTAAFAVSGKVITFPGFLRAYVEGSDDPDAELEDQERILPPLREGQVLRGVSAEAEGHETRPPARYTEASLVRELEQRGIGRPSTYATILQKVQERDYVWKNGTALTPTLTAFAVVNLLEQHFPNHVDFDFTARMEGDLDRVAEGDMEAHPWLRRFYFGDNQEASADLADGGLVRLIESALEDTDARAISSIALGEDPDGTTVMARVGRYGAYVQAGDDGPRASLPDEFPPDELTIEHALALLAEAALGDREVMRDEDTDRPVYVKTGPNGPYVQVGENDDDGGKPKRASLWPGMTIEALTAEQASELLSYPRVLGAHPESGDEIVVQDGRYGPYVKAGKETRSLRDHEHLRGIDLDEAVALLSAPKRRGRAAQAALATLGNHPDSEAPVEVRNGRYGPYVTDGVVNASLPRGRDPSTVTLDEAVDLIAAREARMREQGKDPRAPKPARGGRSRGGSGSRSRSSRGRSTRRRSA